MQLVVPITRTLRKHRLERTKVRGHAVASHVQSADRALVEVAGGRVERVIESLRKCLKRPAVHLKHAASHVDDIESCPWTNLEGDFPLVDGHNSAPLGPRVISKRSAIGIVCVLKGKRSGGLC